MANFPDIQLPSIRKLSFYKPQNRTEFEAGYVVSQARVTRGRWRYELTWNCLIKTELDLITEHFDNNSGNSFIVANTMLNSATDITCLYAEDELNIESASAAGYYKITIKLEEQ